jgi:hypothetical protein
MAKGTSPLIYRLGFFRNWDSLVSESLYIKNFNYFFKTQLINFYVDGFFKKWGWDGRRSYFVNILYSHTEVNWFYNNINLTVYIYNTGIEIINYKFLKELKHIYMFRFKNDFLKEHFFSLNNLFYAFISSNEKINFFDKEKSSTISKNINVKYFYNDLKKFFIGTSKKNKKFIKAKNVFAKFFSKRRKSKVGISTMVLFLFLKKLLRLKLYKTFLNFLNFYYFINPLTKIFKRYFLKDFYSILALKKINNYSKKININFVRLNSLSITSSAFMKHVWLKLYKKYAFGRVIQNIIKTIRSNRYFLGAQIDCNGRFTKKQKAWHKVFRYGKIPMSMQSALLDSSSIFVRLRYGVASVKLNINYV